MTSIETNGYGEPLKLPSLEKVIADLEKLPAELVIAICASLLVTHEPFTCRRTVHLIAEDYKDEGEKSE